jgi:uncharacterized membrane protein
MNTENGILMRKAQESLKGKWALAIGTFLVYMLITGSIGSIRGIGSVLSLIIAGPLTLGTATFSLSISRNREASLEQLFQGFNRFTTAMAAYLLMMVMVLLWSMLLIIPGIIAALSYSMTFFILSDAPSTNATEALNKSKEMMDGYKLKLLNLYLRFFLLALLCVLTLGIGFLWLIPYAHITVATFYEDLKAAHSEKNQ